jgi:DNA-binding NtrC family response regulator
LNPSNTCDDIRALLLVDDDEFVLSALRRTLRGDDYVIHTASSAAQAIELLGHTRVAVVVCDQRMPGMSGIEFLRRVATTHPRIVRLLLSGFGDVEMASQAAGDGVVHTFLTKPWEGESLRVEIRKAFLRHVPATREGL